MVFNWKRAGRLFRELLLQERRGIMEYCTLWEGCFLPAGEETMETAVKHWAKASSSYPEEVL